jgi:hypothetical protein
MAATINRPSFKPERLRQDQAARLRAALLPFENEMPDQVRDLIGYVDRKTAARNGWTFVMISPEQHAAVVEWLLTNSGRPMQAVLLWSKLFTAMRIDTGEILLTRDQLAELVGDTADHVSAIMGELEKIDAIIRRRERVAGMRGPGRARYFMNPVVGTHLAGGERDAAQADAPPGPLLRVMQGGKAP